MTQKPPPPKETSHDRIYYWHNGNRPSQLQDFRSAVLEFEETLIRNALTEAGNKPTVAARLLGLTNHQSLLAMLDNRHKNLRDELNLTKRPRRKTLMKP